MKTKTNLLLLSSLLCVLLFLNVQCPDRFENEYTKYTPLFMTREQMESSVKFIDSVALFNPKKIYVIGNYLFVSEAYKGVHIIDNSDTRNPVIKGFLNVPGCVDMAVKNNILYVDNATDLLAIDITDPVKPVVKKRITDVFPEPSPPDFNLIPMEFSKDQRPAGLILVAWRKKL